MGLTLYKLNLTMYDILLNWVFPEHVDLKDNLGIGPGFLDSFKYNC